VSITPTNCQTFSLISALWPNGPFAPDNTRWLSLGIYGKTSHLHLEGSSKVLLPSGTFSPLLFHG
jgi:hypothetical protein